MHRLIPASISIAIAVAVAACGSSSRSPVAPSASGFGAGANTASITGVVQGATSSLSAASNGHAITGLTVNVVGTDLKSGLDATGRFNLSGVPAGNVQLHFSGPGVDSTVTLSSVLPAQNVTLVVAVAVTSVVVETELRTGAGDAELEARVESLPPTTAAGTFVAGGRTVKTDGGTQFEQGGASRAFADLAIGMRVHVRGRVSGNDLLASVVQIQNTNTSIPVELNGVIDSFTGTLTGFEFKIGSRLVKGDASTEFYGGSAFSSLAEGVRVEVKGQQRDGYIYATRLHVNGDGEDDNDEQDSSASIAGVLTVISGSKPTFTLTVGGTTVKTTATTEVKRRGDVQTLDALALGQTLHVVGDRQPDGSIVARKIEITDDATGGAFEIEGPMGGVSGTCPVLSFSVNGFSVRTTAATTFEGSTCGALKSGTKVTVTGTRGGDGVVIATSVKAK